MVFCEQEKASLKMSTCCRNVTLRRMYLMFEEFLPAFGLDKTDRHDMQKLREAQIAKAAKAKADARSAAAAGPPPSEAMVWQMAKLLNKMSITEVSFSIILLININLISKPVLGSVTFTSTIRSSSSHGGRGRRRRIMGI